MDWKHRTKNEEIVAASYVSKAEMADDGARIALYVESTLKLPASITSFDNAAYTITMQVYHDSPVDAQVGVFGDGSDIEYKKLEFKPTQIPLAGRGRDGVNWRFVVKLSDLPFEDFLLPELNNLTVKATYTNKSDPKDVRILNGKVLRAEERSDGTSITLIVPATEEVPMKNADGSVFDDANYEIVFLLSPAE